MVQDLAGRRMKLMIQMGRMAWDKEGSSAHQRAVPTFGAWLEWGASGRPEGGGKYDRAGGAEPGCQELRNSHLILWGVALV